MKAAPKLLALAVLAALSTPALAETEFDVIGGSEISFEGLIQADFYKYDNDLLNLNASIGDGDDTANVNSAWSTGVRLPPQVSTRMRQSDRCCRVW